MTKRFLNASVVIMTVFLCSFCNLSFSLNIDIQPYHVNGIVHNEVRMKCSLENSDGDVKEIMLLELAKGGSPIAVIRQNSEVSYGTGMESKFQAVGNISKSAVFDSYIHVRLDYPEVSDSGEYTCVMYYLDQLTLLKETRKSGNLTVSDQDMTSALKYLVNKVSSLESDHKANIEDLNGQLTGLEKQMTKQKDLFNKELSDQKNQHKSEISQLKQSIDKQKNDYVARETTLQKHITELTNQINDQQAQFKQIQDKSNTSVYFTALHTQGGVFQNGQNLVYSVVKENVGDGYDGNTGVFTAPVVGFYYFQLSLCPHGNKFIDVDIKSNTRGILARLAAYGDYAFSDTSVIVKLGKEETVWPVAVVANDGLTLWGRSDPDYLHRFSGYLLNAV